MLLETLDIKHNDVIIFSRNVFNLENNFKILSKDDPEKEIRYISYGEVCRYVEDLVPKNLIVYRLLINNLDFRFTSIQYGIAIYINGQSELIFFDPVFAVKELEENADAEVLQDLRFRIQQVGLSTLNRVGNRVNYAEIYSVDLEATEAKFQNDKAFVDALLAVDQNLSQKDGDNPPPASSEPPIRRKKTELKPANGEHEGAQSGLRGRNTGRSINEKGTGARMVRYNISEDKEFDYKKVSKINIEKSRSGETASEKQEVNNSTLKKDGADAEAKSPLGQFLKSKKNSGEPESKSSGEKGAKNDELIGIFKSPSSLGEFLKSKQNKQVVLKLDKK